MLAAKPAQKRQKVGKMAVFGRFAGNYLPRSRS
jgi:hypothetical protein